MPLRIGLVGCVKKKRDVPSRAKDLYLSTLFLGRRSYVERSCDEWWILSAKHGLVNPSEILAPYDLALKGMGHAELRLWSRRVLGELAALRRPSRGDIIEIHAGSEYRDFGLVEGLRQIGCLIENPTKGLPFGTQLQFYANASAEGTDG